MKIIGGMFGLENFRELSERPSPFLQGNYILLANARSGIRLLVQILKPETVWLPSYLCDSMLRAVDQSISKVAYFEVDYHLKIPRLDWLDQVKPNDLVIAIAYFGFPLQVGLAREVKKRGAWFLEDDSQALLSQNLDPQADFHLYSLRKFFGVPDGAILSAREAGFKFPARLPAAPGRWWLQALNASIQRSEFDRNGGERSWFRISQLVESAMPFGPCRMSELSELILRYRVDFQALRAKRTANYQVLLKTLDRYALYPELPAGVAPLGFPVRLDNRNEVRQRMFAQQIYPIVHWDLRGCVPESFQESHRLSRQILTLICDQRYDESDMHRTGKILQGII